jgi:multiple sugar transport system permease protein
MRQSLGARAARHIVLILGAVVVVVLFLWMFTTSLLSRAETYTNTSILPTSWHWENYVRACRLRRSPSTTSTASS